MDGTLSVYLTSELPSPERDTVSVKADPPAVTVLNGL